MKTTINDCAAIILCGGKSSRMGFDKAFLKKNDDLLLLDLITHLKSFFHRVVLISNEKEKFAQNPIFKEHQVLVDHYPQKGPIGAICTAFEEVTEPFIFVMACDMPDVDIRVIQEMYQLRDGQQVVLCKHDGHLEPLFAFYHHSCLGVFQQQIVNNQLQLRKEFKRLHVKEFDIGGNVFINLNTKEDLESWQRKIGGGEGKIRG